LKKALGCFSVVGFRLKNQQIPFTFTSHRRSHCNSNGCAIGGISPRMIRDCEDDAQPLVIAT